LHFLKPNIFNYLTDIRLLK